MNLLSYRTQLPALLLTAHFLISSSFCFASNTVADEISSKQQTQLARIKMLVDKAGKLFKEKKYEESADEIRDAQDELLSLAKTRKSLILKKLKKDHARILQAQKLLRKKKQSFRAMPTLASFAKRPNDDSELPVDDAIDEDNPFESDKASRQSINEDPSVKIKESSPDSGDAKQMVSFTKHVAPIIVEHCGRCHVNDAKGKYSAATYTAMKKPSRKGVVVKPGHPDKSRLISLVESGKMPPRAPQEFPQEKLKILKEWIKQGAKFDGKKKDENLTTFAKQQGVKDPGRQW